MGLNQILCCCGILLFLSCGSPQKIISEDLKLYNLSGPVKSYEQKIYRKIDNDDSLQLVSYCDCCELYFSSFSFEKQKPDEITGIIRVSARSHFDDKGRFIQIDYGENLQGVYKQSDFYEVQSDGINRVIKKIEYNGEKQNVKSFIYEIDLDNNIIITNGTDTLLHVDSYVRNNINEGKIGDENRYIIYNREGQYIERKSGQRLENYEYDDQGRFIRASIKEYMGIENLESEDIIEHVYREGKIVESKYSQINRRTKKPVLVKLTTYEYDIHGNMIKLANVRPQGIDDVFELKIREYDRYNNWTLADYYCEGKYYYLLKRVIKY